MKGRHLIQFTLGIAGAFHLLAGKNRHFGGVFAKHKLQQMWTSDTQASMKRKTQHSSTRGSGGSLTAQSCLVSPAGMGQGWSTPKASSRSQIRPAVFIAFPPFLDFVFILIQQSFEEHLLCTPKNIRAFTVVFLCTTVTPFFLFNFLSSFMVN